MNSARSFRLPLSGGGDRQAVRPFSRPMDQLRPVQAVCRKPERGGRQCRRSLCVGLPRRSPLAVAPDGPSPSGKGLEEQLVGIELHEYAGTGLRGSRAGGRCG